MKKKFDVVGKSRRRVDGRAKATGQLCFADDLSAPRMLHCKLLRSPHPHALVESIDTAKAAKHPGVHLVLTKNDFPVPFGIMPVSVDEFPLTDHVRHVGDPVAAVIAIDEVQLVATIRASGHHRCTDCAFSHRVRLVAVADDDHAADGLPPSASITLSPDSGVSVATFDSLLPKLETMTRTASATIRPAGRSSSPNATTAPRTRTSGLKWNGST